MTFTQSVRTCLNKYGTFKGRASQSEYWWFILFLQLAYFSVVLIGIPLRYLLDFLDLSDFSEGILTSFLTIFILVFGIPHWAVSVRRLHDTGHSGWYLLIGLIPYIGGLYLFYLFYTIGEYGENQYGPDPLEHEEEEEIAEE